jgi:hypothetical protein
LKEYLKLYINFLYNYSVSCLVFEINRDRLILIKSSLHSPSWICIGYTYVTSRAKAKFYLANYMSLSIWNSIFRSLFGTQLDILRKCSKKFSPTWRRFNNYNTKMADCTLFLVKIFRKPSQVRKSCKGSSYITLKVLSNKAKLIFITISR